MPNRTPDELWQFDWVNGNDKLISPVPRVSDFHPTTTPQPICTPPKPTVTPSKCDMALSACTPTTNVSTMLHALTPIAPTKYLVPVTAPPQVPTECTSTMIIPGLCDLSALCSDTHIPWGSLHCCQSGHYAHVPHQFTHQRQYLLIYPANTYLHTTPTPKPPTPTPIHIFEMVLHLQRIRPTKPIIRMLVSLTGDMLAPHSQPRTGCYHQCCHHHQLIPLALFNVIVDSLFMFHLPHNHCSYLLFSHNYFTLFLHIYQTSESFYNHFLFLH